MRSWSFAGATSRSMVGHATECAGCMWLDVARAYDAARMPVENYRAFIELWQNADADLQPQVADARKRLSRLTPVEKRN